MVETQINLNDNENDNKKYQSFDTLFFAGQQSPVQKGKQVSDTEIKQRWTTTLDESLVWNDDGWNSEKGSMNTEIIKE